MNAQQSPDYLGHNVLVVIDPVNGFLDSFRSTVTSLSEIAHKSFTLLCCCLTQYWEHSGADNPEALQLIEAVADKKDREFSRACLDEIKSILREAGALDSHIHIWVSTDDTLIDATMNELNLRHYTGAIISNYHQDIVARLQRRGITDIFRNIPEVEVYMLRLADEITELDM